MLTEICLNCFKQFLVTACLQRKASASLFLLHPLTEAECAFTSVEGQALLINERSKDRLDHVIFSALQHILGALELTQDDLPVFFGRGVEVLLERIHQLVLVNSQEKDWHVELRESCQRRASQAAMARVHLLVTLIDLKPGSLCLHDIDLLRLDQELVSHVKNQCVAKRIIKRVRSVASHKPIACLPAHLRFRLNRVTVVSVVAELCDVEDQSKHDNQDHQHCVGQQQASARHDVLNGFDLMVEQVESPHHGATAEEQLDLEQHLRDDVKPCSHGVAEDFRDHG